MTETDRADLLRRLADALEVELDDCSTHEPAFHLYAIGLVCEAHAAAFEDKREG